MRALTSSGMSASAVIDPGTVAPATAGAVILSTPLRLDPMLSIGTLNGTGSAGEPGIAVQPVTSVVAGPATDIDSVRRMSGAALLTGLSRLSAGDLAAFVAEFPGQVDSLLARPPATTEVTGWWTGLGSVERSSLLAGAPRLIGNLDGIPFRERGRANARYLSRSLAEADRRLAGARDGANRDSLTHELAVLTQVKAALRPTPGGPRRSLILLDTVAGGRAAIALGNVDTAAYVSYLVPGMNYQVESQIVNWTATAQSLYDEQRSVVAERAWTERAWTERGPGDGGVAVVSWIGYAAPDLFSVGGLDHAVAGADFLERYAQGIRSSRAADQPFVSVIAHSYGSTVALTALSRRSFEVDALVLVGSPGSLIQSVDRLSVAGGNVFVGKADWDPAVDSGFFGSDPGAESYGARSLGVSGARDRSTGTHLAGSLGHNAYFDRGSESLHNMALIGTDRADLVTNGSE